MSGEIYQATCQAQHSGILTPDGNLPLPLLARTNWRERGCWARYFPEHLLAFIRPKTRCYADQVWRRFRPIFAGHYTFRRSCIDKDIKTPNESWTIPPFHPANAAPFALPSDKILCCPKRFF